MDKRVWRAARGGLPWPLLRCRPRSRSCELRSVDIGSGCPQLSLNGGSGHRRLLKLDRQRVRCGRSSQAGPEARTPSSMNVDYSDLSLAVVCDPQHRVARQRGAEASWVLNATGKYLV